MKITEPKPPLLAVSLLKLLLKREDYDMLAGDFEEYYSYLAGYKNKKIADSWYWLQIIKCVPGFIYFSIYWGFAMFKNYFKIAFRNIIRHKAYAAINIAGLAIGIASCIIIMLFVVDEISYDKFHKNGENIYRIERAGKFQGRDFHVPVTAYPYGPALVQDYPEIISTVRIDDFNLTLIGEDQMADEERVVFTDANLFNFFSFSLAKGDPQTALVNPNSIVITKEMAIKYLGTEDAIGKMIKIQWNADILNFQVTGILKDLPRSSHFITDFFASFSSLNAMVGEERLAQWINNGIYTYVMVEENTNISHLSKKMPGFLDKYMAAAFKQILGPETNINDIIHLYFQPLYDIHLYSQLEFEMEPQGNITTVSIFFIIAVLILVIASINFMNLSTARSAGRAKEVGLRKVVGATKNYLIKQFLAESVFLAIIALLFAILLVELVLPSFNSFTFKELSFNYISNPLLCFSLFAIAIVTGIGSGLYPAFFLSSFQPAKVLRGSQKSGTGGGTSFLRNGLVIFQFVITITLLSGTLVVMQQMDYIRSKDMGFNKEQVVVVPMDDESIRAKSEVLKDELRKENNVIAVSSSGRVPGNTGWSDTVYRKKGADQEDVVETIFYSVDENHASTMGIELIAGSFFTKEMSTLQDGYFVINEKLAKRFGYSDPKDAVDTYLEYMRPDMGNIFVEGRIIGVVKDYNFKSLHQEIEPLALLKYPVFDQYISIRISGNNIKETIASVEKNFKNFAPGSDFEYYFLDESFERLYRAEERMQQLFSAFSTLAIFIACLGLLGLAAYITERRTKEIGIRKTMGASITQVVVLLSVQFLKWVIIATIVAWPVAYYLMNKWLDDFAYRIELGFLPFIAAALVALVIALGTVMTQTLKAARANPVDSLKY